MVEEIDLRHIPYMPLVIDRLRRSKAWLQCKRRPELAFHMMNLWMHSWHEVPAGSIEADDDVLADAAMCSPERWDEIKGAVLRGWEQGEDGRLYHHVVVELADEAVGKMRSSRARTKKAREALEAKRRSEQSHDGDGDRDGSVAVSVTDAVTKAVTGDEGKGREGKTSGIEEPNGSPIPGADAPSLLDGLGAGDIQRQPKGTPSKPSPTASASDTPEKRLFDRGKEVLGSSAGGMISNLRKRLDYDDEHALRTINLAAEKQNPREWIGRLLAGDASAETDDYAAEVRRRNQEWGVL